MDFTSNFLQLVEKSQTNRVSHSITSRNWIDLPFNIVTQDFAKQLEIVYAQLNEIKPLYIAPPPPSFNQSFGSSLTTSTTPLLNDPTCPTELHNTPLRSILYSAQYYNIPHIPLNWIQDIDLFMNTLLSSLQKNITTLRETVQEQEEALDQLYSKAYQNNITKSMPTNEIHVIAAKLAASQNRKAMLGLISTLKKQNEKQLMMMKKQLIPTGKFTIDDIQRKEIQFEQQYHDLYFCSYQSLQHRTNVLTSLDKMGMHIGQMLLKFASERKIATQRSSIVANQRNKQHYDNSLSSTPTASSSLSSSSSFAFSRHKNVDKTMHNSSFLQDQTQNTSESHDEQSSSHLQQLSRMGISQELLLSEQKHIQESIHNEDLALAQNIEQSVTGVARLVTLFSQHLSVQAEKIETIYENLTLVSENIDSGNEQLSKSLETGTSAKLFSILFVVAAVFLLILDWFFN